MTVVVVGPTNVVAKGSADVELVRIALDCIDDRLAVHDDRILPVRELWCAIAESVLGRHHDRVVLVVPTRWPSARVELVEDAMLTMADDVVIRRRGDVLQTLAPAVVELDPEVPWHVDDVVARVAGAARVVIDGANALDVERHLERVGVEVIRVDDDDVLAAAAAGRPARRRLPMRVIACAVGVSAILAGAAWQSAPTPDRTTWIVEGPVTVEIPADWVVTRVTTGPGSARVQAMSQDGHAEVHLTRAQVSPLENLTATAGTLETALRGQPAGVFEAFRGDDVVAGRPAVTYREVRAGVVDWTVVLDRGVRIAIGCRDASSAEPRRTAVCERAVRSARKLSGTEPAPPAS
jgi:type VII secretion-associated protein (TIGR03931 family)